MFSIAIDGPAGAGKSTIAKLVAQRLGIAYLDTGAMYRAVGLYMQEHGIDPHDEPAVVSALPGVKLDVRFEDGRQHVILNGVDLGERIRAEEVGHLASAVSQIMEVRAMLVPVQRAIARRESIVVDGRDIGTNVLKDATLKVYLTADVSERARRRMLENRGKTVDKTLQQVCEEIEKRDRDDMTRALDPLRQAEDAVLLDTTRMTPDEAADAVIRLLEARA